MTTLRKPLRKVLTGSGNPCAPLASLLLLPALMLCSGLSQADIDGSPEIPVKETDVVARSEPAPAPRAFAVDSDPFYANHIEAAATANNIDAALIRAVISAESGYNPYAVSRAGAVGLMQLMPYTASRYNVANSRDPEQNIHGGARYLRDLLQMFNHDVRLAVAAYNAGEHAVMKYGYRIPPYPETLAYVPKVLKYYAQYLNGAAPMEMPGYQRNAAAWTYGSYRFAAVGTSTIYRVPAPGTSTIYRAAAVGTSTIYRAAAPRTTHYRPAATAMKTKSSSTKVAWTVSTGGNSVVVSRVR
jgi:hypothetical protein